MPRTLIALSSLLLACATTPPPPKTATPVELVAPPVASAVVAAPAPRATDRWKQRAPDPACQAAITALSSGRLADYRGLPRCGRVDAESALGTSGEAASKFEQFGEYRVYPSPRGSILVWFLDDDIRVAELLYPKLKTPLEAVLGSPEAKLASKLSPEWDQLVYAARGLSAHVKRGSGEVISIFAYRPMTTAAFLATDIARVAKSEAPLEDLK